MTNRSGQSPEGPKESVGWGFLPLLRLEFSALQLFLFLCLCFVPAFLPVASAQSKDEMPVAVAGKDAFYERDFLPQPSALRIPPLTRGDSVVVFQRFIAQIVLGDLEGDSLAVSPAPPASAGTNPEPRFSGEVCTFHNGISDSRTEKFK